MTAVISIVSPAVDVEQIERAVHAAHIALRDSDARVAKSESRAAVDREENARCRLALGRSLVEARKAWPARGPRAKGWGDFLARQGIDQDAALRMMSLAGYVEVSRTDGDVREIPTVREVNAARKPAPDPDAPPDDWAREVAARREQTVMPDPPQAAAPTLDIDRELSRLQNKICAFAESVPTGARKMIAHELRQTARLIEEMK